MNCENFLRNWHHHSIVLNSVFNSFDLRKTNIDFFSFFSFTKEPLI